MECLLVCSDFSGWLSSFAYWYMCLYVMCLYIDVCLHACMCVCMLRICNLFVFMLVCGVCMLMCGVCMVTCVYMLVCSA